MKGVLRRTSLIIPPHRKNLSLLAKKAATFPKGPFSSISNLVTSNRDGIVSFESGSVMIYCTRAAMKAVGASLMSLRHISRDCYFSISSNLKKLGLVFNRNI